MRWQHGRDRLGKGKVKLGAYAVAARGRGAHLRCTGLRAWGGQVPVPAEHSEFIR